MHAIPVGLIGCGKIAEIAHLPAYQNAIGVQVVGIADPDAQRLKLMSRKFNITETFEDYHDLLEIENLKAVSVCVPTSFHHEIVVDAARKGKHVLCEKPLALNVREGRDMVTTARKHGIQLYIGFHARFSRVAQEMMRLLEAGFIGRPIMLRLEWKGTLPASGSWYLEREKGGGALFDTGSHGADFLLHNFGKARVSNARFEYAAEGHVDIAAKVNMDIEPDMTASLEVDWRFRSGSERRVTIIGKSGVLSADLNRSTLGIGQHSMILGRQVRQSTLCFEERVPPHWAEIWEFIRSVRMREESSLLSTGEEALTALGLIEEAYGCSQGD